MTTKRSILRVYKSYLWRDKDPIIDAFRTARQDAGMSYREIQEGGGPVTATIRSWESGKTKRPQFTTIWAAMRAMKKGSIKADSKGYPKISD